MTRGCNHTAVLLVALVLLFVLDAPRSVRWVAGLPAFLASIGYLQAATKT